MGQTHSHASSGTASIRPFGGGGSVDKPKRPDSNSPAIASFPAAMGHDAEGSILERRMSLPFLDMQGGEIDALCILKNGVEACRTTRVCVLRRDARHVGIWDIPVLGGAISDAETELHMPLPLRALCALSSRVGGGLAVATAEDVQIFQTDDDDMTIFKKRTSLKMGSENCDMRAVCEVGLGLSHNCVCIAAGTAEGRVPVWVTVLLQQRPKHSQQEPTNDEPKWTLELEHSPVTTMCYMGLLDKEPFATHCIAVACKTTVYLYRLNSRYAPSGFALEEASNVNALCMHNANWLAVGCDPSSEKEHTTLRLHNVTHFCSSGEPPDDKLTSTVKDRNGHKHNQAVTALSRLANGCLVSGGGDGRLRVWRLTARPVASSSRSLFTRRDSDDVTRPTNPNDKHTLENEAPIVIGEYSPHAKSVTALDSAGPERAIFIFSGSDDKTKAWWYLPAYESLSFLDMHCLDAGDAEAYIRERQIFERSRDLYTFLTTAFTELVNNHMPRSTENDYSKDILLMERIYDAVASIIAAERNTKVKQRIIYGPVLRHVLDLVKQDALFTSIAGRRLRPSVQSRLAATRIFRTVIQSKFRLCGPFYIYCLIITSFLALFGAYWMLVYWQLSAHSYNPHYEKICIVVMVPFATLFLVFELRQIAHARTKEFEPFYAGVDEMKLNDDGSPDRLADDLVQYDRSIWKFYTVKLQASTHSLLVSSFWCLVFPVTYPFVVAGRLYMYCTDKDKDDKVKSPFDDLFLRQPSTRENLCELYCRDPLTYVGVPRAWRSSIWNCVDATCISIIWIVIVLNFNVWRRTGHPLKFTDYHDDDQGREYRNQHALYVNLAVVGTLFGWIKILGFLQALDFKFAVFVDMLVKVCVNLQQFMVVMGVIFIGFAQGFYLRLGRRRAEGFHRDDASKDSSFRTFQRSLRTLYLLAVTGDLEQDDFPRNADRYFLYIFAFVVIIVMLNVAIAIVSDTYDDAMANAVELFYSARMQFCTETIAYASLFPPDEARVLDYLQTHLSSTDSGDDSVGRIISITSGVQSSLAVGNRKLHNALSRDAKNLDDRLRALESQIQDCVGRIASLTPLIQDAIQAPDSSSERKTPREHRPPLRSPRRVLFAPPKAGDDRDDDSTFSDAVFSSPT